MKQTAQPVADPPEPPGVSGTANYCRITLLGRLTRNPELRFTSGGVAVAGFGLAVNRGIPTADGAWESQAMFFDVTAWKQTAERCVERLRKGSPVFLVGHFELDEWTKDGVPQNKLRVVADHVQFLEKAPKAQASGTTSVPAATPAAAEDYSGIPF